MTPVEAALAVEQRFGLAEVRILLQRFGVEKLADLPPWLIAEFVDFAGATLLFNEPPSSSWADGVPLALHPDYEI